VRHAFHLAEKFQAAVDLLHVVEENSPARSDALKKNEAVQGYLRDLLESAETQLEAIQPPSSKICVERHVRMGRPYVEILNQAKERFTDLIVTGTHGRTGIAHWFLGSVAEMMVRKAPCPVLVTRPLRQDAVP
jgi:nucleotide-binding universal stress UspA family protein